MDVFNQTVAVKDIQSLNHFIREHMLESKPWNERVSSLLEHFTQLSEAHQSLVRVRRQAELLGPIAQVGTTYRKQASQLGHFQRLLDAADSFFRHKSVELLTPTCESLRVNLTGIVERKRRLGQELAERQEEARRLKNEIEQAGGERLREIPLLIRTHEAHLTGKRQASRRYHDAIGESEIAEEVFDQAAFAAIQAKIPTVLGDLTRQIVEQTGERDGLVVKRGDIRINLRNDEAEIMSLAQRQGNLPEWMVSLRGTLCADLGLSERDLPFAAEIISVDPDHRAWEASIEMVLRGFALSLLVPQRYYHVVSCHVDNHRLADGSGRGQRLVYLRVGQRSGAPSRLPLHGQSLLRKLRFRDGHSLLPWVKVELEERFDFFCCDTLEEFQQAEGLALTRNRHVKYRGSRHEKDDRERSAATLETSSSVGITAKSVATLRTRSSGSASKRAN
ncbi:MAG: hypothetical protein GX621_10860, partial [Pirellulaceae bacterium]|nr:hypothetical protein [Pirellulaceae bacterium]